MQTYELTYIISPETTSEEANAKAKEIESLIVEREGTILKQFSPTAKTLSYPVHGKASGFMGVLEFQLEPERLLEVKDFIVKNKNILRHIVIIKGATELKKDRRSRDFFDKIEIKSAEIVPASIENFGVAKEEKPVIEEKVAQVAPVEKANLKDIEQKLEEILGE